MTLHWQDSPERYGLVSRLLHWAMAAILLWQFGGMILRMILGRTPLMAFWVGSHQSVGLLLLGLVAMRLAWAWANRARRPAHEASVIGLAARIGHGLLYALMVVIPALALLRAVGSGRGLAFFGWQIIERGGPRVDWMVAPANLMHGRLAWLLLALIVGHVAMALLHHFVWRDGLLLRMAGRRRLSAPG